MISKAYSPLMILLVFLLLGSCTREDAHPVPQVMVNFSLNLDLPTNVGLNHPGGYMHVTGGHRGIVIYRHSHNEFLAFDRACPYHPFDEVCRIEADPPLATDPCCGSRFILLDGSVIKGPAQWPLRQYRTQYNHPYLHITN